MFDLVEHYDKVREAVVAYPEPSMILFFTGLGLGWAASWLVAQRELKVNRLIIATAKDPSGSPELRDRVLRQSLPQRRFGLTLKSLALLVLIAFAAFIAGKTIQPEFPRQISDRQKLILLENLILPAGLKSNAYILYDSNCADCKTYAYSIAGVLHGVRGWEVGFGVVTSVSLGATAPPPPSSGLEIWVLDKEKMPAVSILTKAFEAASIKFEVVSRQPFPPYDIQITVLPNVAR